MSNRNFYDTPLTPQERAQLLKREKDKIFLPLKEALDQYKPKEIVKYLDQYVIGQDKAKKVLAVAIYNHYKRVLANNGYIGCANKSLADVNIEKDNVMVLGETGSGKTFIVKTIAKLLNIPIYISDASGLTAAGYVGNDVESMITGLLQAADHNILRTQIGICIIDEIDKIARKGENVSITRDVSGEDCQQGMLKILESTIVGVMPNGGRLNPSMPLTYVDTTNILFIGLGSFEGIERKIESRIVKKSIGYKNGSEEKEDLTRNDVLDHVTPADLRAFGMIPELVGRFPIIAHTCPLSKEDLVSIIKEPKNSLLKQYKKLLAFDNVELVFRDDALGVIADMALETKTGARGLRGVFEKILINVMYEASDMSGKKYVITSDLVKNMGKATQI